MPNSKNEEKKGPKVYPTKLIASFEQSKNSKKGLSSKSDMIMNNYIVYVHDYQKWKILIRQRVNLFFI